MGAGRLKRQPPGPLAQRPIAAFDFDGTLTIRDSYTGFLRWRAGPLRWAAGLAETAPAAAAWIVHRDRGRLKAAATRAFLRGVPRAQLEADAEGYAAEAEAAAAGAAHLLAAARVFPTLAEAVADLRFVWATTARERGQSKRIATPAQAMPETAAAMLGASEGGDPAGAIRHGILFGPERTGMDNDEIATADAIMTFPVNPAYASLNLAQAVLLVGYEWMQASTGDRTRFQKSERSPPAPREMVLSFFDFLEDELERRGFFRPLAKAPVMKRNLRNIFHRIGLSEQDISTLRGAVVRLVEGPREAAGRSASGGTEDGNGR